MEDHVLVPSLSDNLLKARHIPGCLNVMADLLSRSNQVQSMEWSLYPKVFKQICHKRFTPHVDLFAIRLNHRVQLYVSQPFIHRVIKKIRQTSCLIIVIALGWPGMPWFWDLVQVSTEIPLQLPGSRTLLKQSHNYVFRSNPQHLNLHTWCLGVESSKNNASLWRWQ